MTPLSRTPAALAAARGAGLKLLDGYSDGTRRWDAMWDAVGGAAREHWLPLLSTFETLGVTGIEDRCAEAERLLRENGVGFEVGRSDEEMSRRVAFDPVPVIIGAEQWQHIESGLRQRARLLDLVLKDIYGPRELMRDGVIPSEVIFRHEGFLPACAQPEHPGLLLYAADIAWDAAGNPRVVADRAEAPAGVGYALETRIVCSRILPNVIRAQPVLRLAGFFQTLRQSLRNLAPNQHFDPRTVLLNRGPGDPGYFDHAYLAGYLGYPLLQGQDLTVREGHLWLKTVEGLKLVDVVLRRLADDACDALELNANEDAGVPGLLQAAREGNVVLANALGASVLENPALMGVIPAAADYLLGERLRLDSVGSWWCGDAASRQHVLANLDRTLVKSIAPQVHSVFAPSASEAERLALIARVCAEPSRFVGQEVLDEASAPGWVQKRLAPVRTVTRFFLVKSGSEWHVMPGGFSRSAAASDFGRGLSTLLKGKCKDTWILAGENERHRIVWPASPGMQTFTGERESLPSRAAECLYWVGRYAERAEAIARLARVLWNRQLDADESNEPADAASAKVLQAVLELRTGALGDHVQTGIRALLTNKQRNGSLVWCLNELSRSANAVRDRWSNDTWRLIDDLASDIERLGERASGANDSATPATLDSLISRFSSFVGLTQESMTKEDGWRFLMIGRRIERAFGLVRLLRGTLNRTYDDESTQQVLESVLTVGESIITHRRRFRAYLAPETLIELMVLDPLNPRSLAAALEELKTLVESLPRPREMAGRSAEERALLQLTTDLRLSDAVELAAEGDERRPVLAALLSKVEKRMNDAADAIEHHYFAHVKARRLAPEREI